MLKKLLCIVTLLLAITCVLVSCSGGDSDHTHTYGAWTTTKDATCTENGSEFRTCECGKKDVRPIPATGHTYGDWVLSVDATCLESVPATRACHCGATETDLVIGEHNKTGDVCALCWEGRYIYTEINGGYRIDGLVNENETNIVIPSSYNGLPIKAIADYAFEGCTNLKSVTVNMPKADEEGIVNALSSIGASAFSGCISLESVKIPSTVTSIGKYAFFGCSALKSVSFDGVKTEKSVALNVGSQAFFDCVNISSVNVKDVAAWSETVFADATANPLYYAKKLYVDSSSYVTSITLPETVTYIAPYAFVNLVNLKSIKLTDKITSVGDFAFSGCSSLEAIAVPSSVKSIGNGAFEGCISLDDVDIKNGVMTIGHSVFEGCASLSSVDIPDSVVSLGAEAFMNCSRLETVKLSNSIKLIGYSTFQNCSELYSVNIPASLKEVGNYAFYDCLSLDEVHLSDVGAWCEIIFNDEYATPLMYATNLYVDNEEDGVVSSELLTELVVPAGTKYIRDYAFKNYKLTSVSIPGSVYSIGKSAFEGCDGITELKISDGIAKISESAFKGCSEIPEIIFPDSIVSIGVSAFEGCSSLDNVSFKYGVASIADFAFAGCSSIADIAIPDSVSAIGASAFKGCEAVKTLDIGSSVVSLGDSAFEGCALVEALVIPDSVTSIGKSAFSGCAGITEIKISKNLTTLGEAAFAGCESIVDAVIPAIAITAIYTANFETLEIVAGSEIPADAFKNCSALTSIIIAPSISKVDSSAFVGCDAIEYIEIPAAAISAVPKTAVKTAVINAGTSIAAEAFKDCALLTSIKLVPTITSVGVDAFTGTNIEYAEMSASALMTTSGDNSISNLPKDTLKTVVINSGTTIMAKAFSGYKQLESVTMADTIVEVQSSAFASCSALTDVYFLGTEEVWGLVAIKGGNASLTKATVHFAE